MIQTGSLLSVQEGIIVHGCNAQGVMGSGVAKLIRDKYPVAFERYRAKYDKDGLALGSVVWAKVQDSPLLAVASGITQEYYGRTPGKVYVDYDAISNVFSQVAKVAHERNLTVHYPMIGAGLGGGDWDRIKYIITAELVAKNVSHHLWIPPSSFRPSP